MLALDLASFSQEQFRLVCLEVEVKEVKFHTPRFRQAQILGV